MTKKLIDLDGLKEFKTKSDELYSTKTELETEASTRTANDNALQTTISNLGDTYVTLTTTQTITGKKTFAYVSVTGVATADETAVPNIGYLSQKYYTQTQVDNLISNLKKATMQVVETLPTEGVEGVIYLVGTAQPYEMYIWENGAYIDIGSTEVDLTNYYTKTETDTKLNAKQNTLTAGTNITISGTTISAKDTTYSAATTSAAGLMSSSDKTKLDGIATGATKVTVDTALSSTSTNPVQNKVINTALSGKQATLSTAQLAAANSGITADKVTSYDALVTAIGSDTTYATTAEIDALF